MAGFSPIVHSVTGDYAESLNDAKIATGLQPSLLKAFVRGKSAMIHAVTKLSSLSVQAITKNVQAYQTFLPIKNLHLM